MSVPDPCAARSSGFANTLRPRTPSLSDTLLGDDAAKTRAKRGPAPKLQQHLERISTLPKAKQKFVMDVLESVLAQQGR